MGVQVAKVPICHAVASLSTMELIWGICRQLFLLLMIFWGPLTGPGGGHHYQRAGCSIRCQQENKSYYKVKSIFHLIPPFIIESLRGSYRASINHFFKFSFYKFMINLLDNHTTMW